MRRRGYLLLIVALLGLPLSGCWSRLETNELAVVIAYGVDWHAGRYEVTASVLDPRALGTPGQATGKPNEPAHIIMAGTGATPAQALADVDNESSRRVLWGSAEVAVIGQSLAEHGIGPLLAALTHDAAFRPTIRVLIAHGDARDMFTLDKSGLETSIGRQLYLMAENQHRAQSYSWSPHVFDLFRWEAEEQRAILVPAVTGSQPQVPEGQAYRIDDSAVLDRGRLVGWMPRDQVRAVLWVEGLFIHGRFQVDCPGGSGQQGLVLMTSGQKRVRPVAQGGRIKEIRVDLNGRGEVVQNCPGASVGAMSAAASDTVAAAVRQSLRWAQGRHLDVFGFGETSYRALPRLWLARYRTDWPEAFGDMPVEVSVRVLVPEPGLSR